MDLYLHDIRPLTIPLMTGTLLLGGPLTQMPHEPASSHPAAQPLWHLPLKKGNWMRRKRTTAVRRKVKQWGGPTVIKQGPPSLPEQLEILYEKYLLSSIPWKMLDHIARKLRAERVVQVWFQNTRARGKKRPVPGSGSSTIA